MNIQLIAEQMLNGVVLGSMYALVASGLTLIWGTMKMLNFAIFLLVNKDPFDLLFDL